MLVECWSKNTIDGMAEQCLLSVHYFSVMNAVMSDEICINVYMRCMTLLLMCVD